MSLEKLQEVHRLRGGTYSSYEVIGLIGWAASEIERLRAKVEDLEQQIPAPAPDS